MEFATEDFRQAVYKEVETVLEKIYATKDGETVSRGMIRA